MSGPDNVELRQKIRDIVEDTTAPVMDESMNQLSK